MLETEGALPPARRRRRRPRKAVVTDRPVTASIAVVTVIRADHPFDSEAAAEDWFGRLDDSDYTGEILDDAIATLDRARAADAATSGLPFGTRTEVGSILTARVGYGEGERVASGRFLEALEVDARGGTASGRREKIARTGSLARTAAILGGRERSAACEVLVPRVRLDLDTGNDAAARLTIEAAAEATINELEFALDDPDHEDDLDRLEQLLPALAEVSGRAAKGEPDPGGEQLVENALEIAERIIRRRRILEQ